MNHYIFNPDFIDFIDALNTSSVKYLLVGGYAVILNGYIRTTGDMDIWVLPTKENYQQLSEAFYRFGMPTFDMTLQKFLLTEQYDVFTFGRPPVSIDILTKVKGLSFYWTIRFNNSKTICRTPQRLRRFRKFIKLKNPQDFAFCTTLMSV